MATYFGVTYYDSGAGEDKPIPFAPFYVVSIDTFMSGWGPAEGKTNVVIVPCPDFETAKRVRRYANSRGDQKQVKIRRTLPANHSDTLHSLANWIPTAEREGF